MKYVKEHIDEKFEEKTDPVSDMGIGVLADIEKRFKPGKDMNFSKMTPNQLLIVGISYSCDDLEARTDLIKYALKNGANQLWCNSDGSISEILKITNVGKGDWMAKYPKITFKRVWTRMHGKFQGSPKTSTQFSYKYRSITKDTLTGIDEHIKNLKDIKQTILELNPTPESRPY